LVPYCRDRGVAVLIGDAADPELLRKARAPQASHLISVTGDDGVNVEVGMSGRELARRKRRGLLACLVHVVDLELWRSLPEYEMRMGKLDRFRLGFFNVYESGSRALLCQFPPFAERNRRGR
jgi:hypothetical protein